MPSTTGGPSRLVHGTISVPGAAAARASVAQASVMAIVALGLARTRRMWISLRAASPAPAELLDPVVRDRVAPGEPHRPLLLHVHERPLEPANAAGATDHPEMQADREHLRRRCPFPPQRVERVRDVLGEIAGGDEALGPLVKMHVVRVEAVRDDEMAGAGHVDEERQIVAVGVGVVKEPAVLDEEPPGIR